MCWPRCFRTILLHVTTVGTLLPFMMQVAHVDNTSGGWGPFEFSSKATSGSLETSTKSCFPSISNALDAFDALKYVSTKFALQAMLSTV